MPLNQYFVARIKGELILSEMICDSLFCDLVELMGPGVLSVLNRYLMIVDLMTVFSRVFSKK